MNQDFADLRRDYQSPPLHRQDMDPDPLIEFGRWLEKAAEGDAYEANAMTLSTCEPDGRPASRIVLLKGLDSRGFVFYTNYHSRKGRELAQNPRSCLLFYWPHQHRQVRVEGLTELVDEAESDAYFQTRPRGAQLGAWASRQSQEVGSRSDLEKALVEVAERFPDQVPRPPHWGGYRVVPDLVEFWQGRPDRHHDRIEYHRVGDSWQRRRLMP